MAWLCLRNCARRQGAGCAGLGLWTVESGLSHPWLSYRDCCGPHLLLPRGCLPQPAWRQEAAADPQLPVSARDDNSPATLPQTAPYTSGDACWPQLSVGPSLQEAATGCPTGGRRLPAPPGGAARTPAAMTLPRARASPSPSGLFSWPLAGLHSTPNSRLQESNLSWRWGWCPGPAQINRMTCISLPTALAPCLGWPHPSTLGRCCWP